MSKVNIGKIIAIILAAALFAASAAGCAENAAPTPAPTPTAAPSPTPLPAGSTAAPANSLYTPVSVDVKYSINTYFAPDFNKKGSIYAPIQVTPSVPDYTVSPDLSNVVNLNQIPNLTAEQKKKLAANGFVVASSKQEQLFYIYEDNAYKDIPNFITTDSVLQVYHMFYDYALRSVEGATLLPVALQLNANMLAQLQREYAAISDPEVKAEAKKALAYFGVAQLAFGEELPSDFPEEAKALATSEMELFNAADGRYPSPIFEYEIDYSLFTPRGHYTRSDEMKKYFRGMSWYGVTPLPFYKTDGTTRDTRSAMCAIVITTALSRLDYTNGGALWENIYSPTKFFVGASDDATPFQLAEIIKEVYGEAPDLNTISDASKLDAFYKKVDELPKAQINAKNDLAKLMGENVPEGPQLRFMGQRYIPDSEILQELSEPEWPGKPGRAFPSGLDVFASLGSKRAEDLIAIYLKPAEAWPDYTKNFERMKAKFTSHPESTWQSNLYYAWLWTQSSLTGEYGKGYPMFMRNTAWQDKSLSTALASWAEMRHDTILYSKGSAAEKGGDAPPLVYQYVEPNVELYNRLLWLTAYMRENLEERKILPNIIKVQCENFESLLIFLRNCAYKELKGEALTKSEYDVLRSYGGRLESLTTRCVENAHKWHQITSETDRNMAVIADVHTAIPGGYLEEGVGTANEIYVIAPIEGKLYITRGAVFDYYEFVSQKRLSDEEWQAMLKTSAPKRPAFTSSFIAGEAQKVPAPSGQYQAGGQ